MYGLTGFIETLTFLNLTDLQSTLSLCGKTAIVCFLKRAPSAPPDQRSSETRMFDNTPQT